jgi:hypothetical protein
MRSIISSRLVGKNTALCLSDVWILVTMLSLGSGDNFIPIKKIQSRYLEITAFSAPLRPMLLAQC